MKSSTHSHSTVNRAIVLGSSVVVVAGLYVAQAVLIPITLSVLFAFLLNPLVGRLKRWGVGHLPAVAVVGTLALLTLLVLAGLFTIQVADLVADLPAYSQRIKEKLEVVWAPLQEYLGRAQESVQQISAGGNAAEAPAPDAIPVVEVTRRSELFTSWLTTFAAPLGTFAIVTVLAGAMLIQGSDLRDRIVRLVGYGQVSITTQALDDVGERVSSYLLAQTILNVSQGTVIAIGLLLIGVPNAIFFAISWTILRFLPYIGPWLGAIFPVLTALGHFDGLRDPILTVILFVVVELVGNMILEPWFYGRRTGLSPLAVIVSAVFWTWLWGWVGLLLATPMTVCLAVLGKYVEPLEFLHVLLGDEPVLRPSARLYQRLLSHNPQEAKGIIAKELEKRGTIEVFQNTIIRALANMDEDRLKGWIDESKTDQVYAELKTIIDELDEPADPSIKFVSTGKCLCIPARDQADVLCGRLLQILCRTQGIEVEVAASGYLASEKAALVAKYQPDVVLVSTLSAARLPFLRHSLKSIAARTDVPLVAGIWHPKAESDSEAADRSGVVVVTTFPEALDALRLAINAHKEGAVPLPSAVDPLTETAPLRS